MTEHLTAPPVLSTPESHVFEDPTPILEPTSSTRLNDDEIYQVYEVVRTAREIREGGWRRVALQFPDVMLCDAPKVLGALEKELAKAPAGISAGGNQLKTEPAVDSLEKNFNTLQTSENSQKRDRVRLYILADTSYGACCVDEVAAEHVDAEVVVHYGRSCLSPTARLPVIYVFTSPPLSISSVVEVFQATYPEKDSRVIIMADIPFHTRIAEIVVSLKDAGYGNILAPDVVHDPGSRIPNRAVDENIDIKEYSLFHISDPPTSLLLTLSSQVRDMYIYPTTITQPQDSRTPTPSALRANTSRTLSRRYAIITSLSTCPVYGILVNTLSVKNYLHTIDALRSQIAAAGKKSYTFVVGKVNAAKVANFSEIGGWVVVGCWESGLVEGQDFYRPVITPFELGMALMDDEDRVWTGAWRGGFEGLNIEVDGKNNEKESDAAANQTTELEKGETSEKSGLAPEEDEDTEEESQPPEFDLRTGRYVSHSRPMRKTFTVTEKQKPIGELEDGQQQPASKVLTRRARMDLATVNGEVSPGAEFLRNKRTWQGLGSDFHEVSEEERVQGGLVEQGRSGIARGYTVGKEEQDKR